MIRKGLRQSFLLAVSLSLAASTRGQTPGRTPIPVPPATPLSADVASIDGMVKAYYDVICGPAGVPRQWSRDRTLYVPDVRFVIIREKKDGSGSLSAVSMTHQEYVDESNPSFVKEGFDEREIYRVTEQFGSIANVFSTYESRRKADGPVIGRGINSLQLFHDGKRWWIASATWQDESTKHPIPKKYLPPKSK